MAATQDVRKSTDIGEHRTSLGAGVSLPSKTQEKNRHHQQQQQPPHGSSRSRQATDNGCTGESEFQMQCAGRQRQSITYPPAQPPNHTSILSIQLPLHPSLTCSRRRRRRSVSGQCRQLASRGVAARDGRGRGHLAGGTGSSRRRRWRGRQPCQQQAGSSHIKVGEGQKSNVSRQGVMCIFSGHG